jgi:hypothetical protein
MPATDRLTCSGKGGQTGGFASQNAGGSFFLKAGDLCGQGILANPGKIDHSPPAEDQDVDFLFLPTRSPDLIRNGAGENQQGYLVFGKAGLGVFHLIPFIAMEGVIAEKASLFFWCGSRAGIEVVKNHSFRLGKELPELQQLNVFALGEGDDGDLFQGVRSFCRLIRVWKGQYLRGRVRNPRLPRQGCPIPAASGKDSQNPLFLRHGPQWRPQPPLRFHCL